MTETQASDDHAYARIFQKQIPFDVTSRALPGIQPAQQDEWLTIDDAFAQQMAYRTSLIGHRRGTVLAMEDGALPAAVELLGCALGIVTTNPQLGYKVEGDLMTRPDGASIRIDETDPLGTLGRLVQQDLCILEKQGNEHVLTGAVLCFPASWSLAEKFQRPLTRIHDPVPDYDDQIARRVQRLFDGVQVGRPLWRFNKLWYLHPDLHQPRSRIGDPREKPGKGGPSYFRSEKQVIFRLPKTQAVVFSIHTFVLPNGVAPAGA